MSRSLFLSLFPFCSQSSYPAGRTSEWQRKLKNCNYTGKNETRTPPHTMWFRHSGMSNSLPPHGLQRARPPCSSSSKVFPNTVRKDKFKINHRPKCKTRKDWALRGKHRQNTLWHKSQQAILWPTSQSNRNKCTNKQMGPSQEVALSHSVMSDSLWPPWTVARQAPLSMGFPRLEYWSGLRLPSPGYLPNPGIKPMSPASPALAGRFFTTSTTWEAHL